MKPIHSVGDQVLLPANRGFIAFSLIAALLLNILPWGKSPWVPDFLAGLIMDVHNGALLGESALAYSIISYGAISVHRRVPWYGMFGQMLHVLPLFLLAQLITVVVHLLVGSGFPQIIYFFKSIASTLMWPFAMAILFAPQRRPVERDENRPL